MLTHNYGLTPDKALELMKTERLDFDTFGDDIIHAAKIGIVTGHKDGMPIFGEGDPIHPESPDAVRICANFERVSAVFSFDTDDAELISQFKAAIKKNRRINHGSAESQEAANG
jgi:hypothetical protein